MGDQLQALDQVRASAIDLGMKFGVELLPLIAGLGAAVVAIEEVLRGNARVLQDPAPVIRVSRLADSCVTIRVAPWVQVPDYGAAIGEINHAILEKFRAVNIVIPFPQREVRMLEPRA